MTNFLTRLFAPKPAPNRPLVEYPSGDFCSITQALRVGLGRYRELAANKPVDICWQGQGARLDSYNVKEIRLSGSLLSSAELPIQWEAVCGEAGLDYAKLKTERAHELNVESLSIDELAHLIESVFVKHLAMKPWDDSKDFCLAIEYVETA